MAEDIKQRREPERDKGEQEEFALPAMPQKPPHRVSHTVEPGIAEGERELGSMNRWSWRIAKTQKTP